MATETAREFYLRFVQGNFVTAAGDYGGPETYGETGMTYGQEALESAEPTTQYEILPSPGFHPQDPAWRYRVGDETEFACIIVEHENPSQRLDVTSIAQATLFITSFTFDTSALTKEFELTPDEATDELKYVWLPFDLDAEGAFRVIIQIVFDTGRTMTIETNDQVLMHVHASSALPDVDPPSAVFL